MQVVRKRRRLPKGSHRPCQHLRRNRSIREDPIIRELTFRDEGDSISSGGSNDQQSR